MYCKQDQLHNIVNVILFNIFQAFHKVGQTKTNVTLALQQVDKALAEVAEIIKELENLPEIGALFSVPFY